MRDLGTLRMPSVPPGQGLYESLYLTATAPDGERALWLRHTWLKQPGHDPEPILWVTWWGPELTQHRGPGAADLTATGSRGSVGDHAWDLHWQSSAPPVPYLPGVLYDRWFPRSNGAVLVPHGTVTGTFDGHDLTGWTAVVGHNWGAEHAHQWEWLHGAAGDDWFDQLRVKPFARSPWLTVAPCTSAVRRRAPAGHSRPGCQRGSRCTGTTPAHRDPARPCTTARWPPRSSAGGPIGPRSSMAHDRYLGVFVEPHAAPPGAAMSVDPPQPKAYR